MSKPETLRLPLLPNGRLIATVAHARHFLFEQRGTRYFIRHAGKRFRVRAKVFRAVQAFLSS